MKAGSLTGIVGPNGAGKSTLNKNFIRASSSLSGNVQFFGSSFKKMKKRIGYVPQRGSVDWDFPTNALDVVMMGLYGQIGWLKRPIPNPSEKRHMKHWKRWVWRIMRSDKSVSYPADSSSGVFSPCLSAKCRFVFYG